jgi:NAD+-dependent protein deacetylase sirtuin 4
MKASADAARPAEAAEAAQPAQAGQPAALDTLLSLLRGRRIVVLGGAGCSTESGIPDYRGADGRQRARSPVQYQEFVRSEAARVRYWSRSMVGWPRIAAARPNAGHAALARLEAGGVVHGMITQNVDGLHHTAGSRRVVELHGSLARVRCLGCGSTVGRDDYQAALRSRNPAWAARLERVGFDAAPDGDAELPAADPASFRVPGCEACGGVMKPDVVFFGENVPRPRVDEAWHMLGGGDVLLVAGSSLTVYSGRRFTDRAAADGMPIAIVNVGPTRADHAAAVKVEAPLGRVLPVVAGALLGVPG